MDDKQKEIEEMANIIKNTWLVDLEGDTMCVCEVLDEVDIKGIAGELVEQDYRKITEDNIVLSREEADRFRGQTLNIKKVKAQASKETATDIINELKYIESVKDWEENEQLVEFGKRISDKLYELAQRYGVDIGEEV